MRRLPILLLALGFLLGMPSAVALAQPPTATVPAAATPTAIHITIDLIVADGPYVVEDYTATGTQDGTFQGRPPSGKQITWTGINIFRIECGKIVEIWSEVDALSRNQQLNGTPIATPQP